MVTDMDADGREGGGGITPDDLLRHLDDLGVEHRTLRHAPVYTVAEARATRGALPGGHSKNLFLRNKKGRMWLVTCDADRRIDLKALGHALGTKALSFASAERLERFLGVIPGAVTPFAVVNDREGRVEVVIDRSLMGHELLNFHPLDNAMTTAVTPDGLLCFLQAADHPPAFVDFDAF